ncbi:MAG: hypothetical protein K2I75_06170 [Clostridiales bacterium]|nr:hypothetical protein [Clostridiales bacterium]
MEKQRITRKNKICIIVAVIAIVGMIVGFGFIIYYNFHTSPSVRKKMVNHYSDDNSYVVVYAKIASTPPKPNVGDQFWFEVEFIGEIDESFIKNSARGFYMPAADYDIMVSNGLDFKNRETVYKFLASPWIWWDGGQPFAVAVFSEDGQTVYLDYETGKNNLLYYIKNDLD